LFLLGHFTPPPLFEPLLYYLPQIDTLDAFLGRYGRYYRDATLRIAVKSDCRREVGTWGSDRALMNVLFGYLYNLLADLLL